MKYGDVGRAARPTSLFLGAQAMGSKFPDWQVGDRILEMRSHWFTLIGEHWRDHQGQPLEYWRVERADSVVVMPIQGDRLILPPALFRPGIGTATLDFPGGRLPEGIPLEAAAEQILMRELGVERGAIAHLLSLTPQGWIVNSSFSNQRLFGFVAHLHPQALIPATAIGEIYSATPEGVQALLQQLLCLQCRALLLEWWMKKTHNEPC